MLLFGDELNKRFKSNVLENDQGDVEGEEDIYVEDEEVEESILQFSHEAAMHILLEQEEKEALIDEGEIEEMEEEGAVTESTVVRLDRDSRLKQLTRVISYKIAREKKDPNFIKLLKIWRIERNLEEKVNKKYSSQAKRIASKELRENYKQVGRKYVKVRGKGVNRKGKGK